MTKIKHYGPYRVTISEQDKRVIITRISGLDPVPPAQLEKLKGWLLNDLADYTWRNYQVIDETIEAEPEPGALVPGDKKIAR